MDWLAQRLPENIMGTRAAADPSILFEVVSHRYDYDGAAQCECGGGVEDPLNCGYAEYDAHGEHA